MSIDYEKEVKLKFPNAYVSEYGPINEYPKQYSIWDIDSGKKTILSFYCFKPSRAWASAYNSLKNQNKL